MSHFTEQQREAAAVLLCRFSSFGPQCLLHEVATEGSWVDLLIDKQCELTEALKLLRVSTHTFEFVQLKQRLDYFERKQALLKRSTPPVSQPENSE